MNENLEEEKNIDDQYKFETKMRSSEQIKDKQRLSHKLNMKSPG
jgi:hypothetical protein